VSGFVYSFSTRFAPLVESGSKRQTIRVPRKDGRVPEPGDVVHLFTGMRTRACRRLGQGNVTECFPVRIDFNHPYASETAHRSLGLDECDAFARLDGFEDATEMIGWFFTVYSHRATMRPFLGYCIRWSVP
jgi:hypothetical protein